MAGVRLFSAAAIGVALAAAGIIYGTGKTGPAPVKVQENPVLAVPMPFPAETKLIVAGLPPAPPKIEIATVEAIKPVALARPKVLAPEPADIVGSIAPKLPITSPDLPVVPLLPPAMPLPVERTTLGVAPLPLPRPVELASIGVTPLLPPATKPREAAPPLSVAPSQAAKSKAKAGPLSARLAAKGFQLGDNVFIRIFKDESKLEVWMSKGEDYSLFEAFPICKWSGAFGPKQVQGDYQSPEGFYMVGRKQLNPNSAYHLAFNLGYPNAYDKAHGRTGSALMVHGDCKSVGCFAMTNGGIEEIYALVEAALAKQAEVPVHIFPFRPTRGALFRNMLHPWRGFWANLAEGYEAFEQTKRPPEVGVCNRSYVFGAQAASCQRIAAW